MAKKNDILFAQERKSQILDLVNKRKKVTVAELCDYFKVSSATIRNDLKDLQLKGLLIRTHGGAIEKNKMGFELDMRHRKTQNLAEKQKIANIAINLIEDGDKIILDTGTTTLELAKLLYQKKEITVVTNDIEIARVLEDHNTIQIILMGGIIRKKFHCTVGILGNELCGGLRTDKAFMGVNALSLANGASTPDIYQAQAKKSMIAIANKVILLCDSSKIGRVSFVQFATLKDIDTIVTDSMDEKTRAKFEENGVEVLL